MWRVHQSQQHCLNRLNRTGSAANWWTRSLGATVAILSFSRVSTCYVANPLPPYLGQHNSWPAGFTHFVHFMDSVHHSWWTLWYICFLFLRDHGSLPRELCHFNHLTLFLWLQPDELINKSLSTSTSRSVGKRSEGNSAQFWTPKCLWKPNLDCESGWIVKTLCFLKAFVYHPQQTGITEQHPAGTSHPAETVTYLRWKVPWLTFSALFRFVTGTITQTFI